MQRFSSDVWTDHTQAPPSWFSTISEPQQEEISFLINVYPELAVGLSDSNEPLLRMTLEGQHAKVQILITFPVGYPEYECPSIRLRSASICSEVIRDLQSQLQKSAQEYFDNQCYSTMTVFGFATEKVVDLPLALQSSHFGVCLLCNKRTMKKENGKKVAQPAMFDEKKEESICLTCKSDEALVVISSATQNLDKECSYCFSEDNPMIKLECGCVTCVSCVQTLIDIATGAKNIKKNIRTRQYGVYCPNHLGTIITDPILFKLCETRCFLRFNNFTLTKCAEQYGFYQCPVPNCCGFPFQTDVRGGFVFCPFCKQASCATCHQPCVACECKELPLQSRLSIDMQRKQIYRDQQMYCLTKAWTFSKVAHILFCYGEHTLPLSLKMDEPIEQVIPLLPFLSGKEKSEKNAEEYQPLFVFHGLVLQSSKPIRSQGLFSGCLVSVIQSFPQWGCKPILEEIELWNFRKAVSTSSDLGADEVAGKSSKFKFCKACPKCKKPVAHYRNHGCHHIGFAGASCCGHHWCYVCLKEWPCNNPKCTLFCNSNCGCPECPDCKPMRPCVLCSGCERCQPQSDLDFQ